MGFEAHETAKKAAFGMKEVIAQVHACDAGLVDDLRRAAKSMVLNLGEGARRQGRDRLQHYRISAGSAGETRDSLELAMAWGYVERAQAVETLELLDRVLAML